MTILYPRKVYTSNGHSADYVFLTDGFPKTFNATNAITRPTVVTARLTISMKCGPLISRRRPQMRLENTPPRVIEQLI